MTSYPFYPPTVVGFCGTARLAASQVISGLASQLIWTIVVPVSGILMYIASPGTPSEGSSSSSSLTGQTDQDRLLRMVYGRFTALQTWIDLYGHPYTFYGYGMQLFLCASCLLCGFRSCSFY